MIESIFKFFRSKQNHIEPGSFIEPKDHLKPPKIVSGTKRCLLFPGFIPEFGLNNWTVSIEIVHEDGDIDQFDHQKNFKIRIFNFFNGHFYHCRKTYEHGAERVSYTSLEKFLSKNPNLRENLLVIGYPINGFPDESELQKIIRNAFEILRISGHWKLSNELKEKEKNTREKLAISKERAKIENEMELLRQKQGGLYKNMAKIGSIVVPKLARALALKRIFGLKPSDQLRMEILILLNAAKIAEFTEEQFFDYTGMSRDHVREIIS